MNDRLGVTKTYKLFIDGKFPRSESGRTLVVTAADGAIAHVAHASRKDVRDAVVAARKAQETPGGGGWAGATSYNRGQILYRLAEMLEGRREEFGALLGAYAAAPAGAAASRKNGRAASKGSRRPAALPPEREVDLAIDRLVAYAGWADKYAQVLGCNNPVSGPYYNFTVPEPTGVVGVVCPDRPPLLGLVSLLAPVICAGNTAVVVAGEANPVVAAVFAEAVATSDLPAGVVNILTGRRAELVPVLAGHRDMDAIHAAEVAPAEAEALRAGAAENVKRVTVREGVDFTAAEACASPWWIEPFVEFKTVWHPSGA